MGEQMLSCEYYYLGSQLPINWFLTFYYGHPGFHIKILVIKSVQIFPSVYVYWTNARSLRMLIIYPVLYLSTLNKELTICRYNSHGDFIGGQSGCYNLVPVFDWIRRCIASIFTVFFIAFLPLFLQGLSSGYPI